MAFAFNLQRLFNANINIVQFVSFDFAFTAILNEKKNPSNLI